VLKVSRDAGCVIVAGIRAVAELSGSGNPRTKDGKPDLPARTENAVKISPASGSARPTGTTTTSRRI
jgi:hypothetical protein